jgi:hypothetical protein
MARAVIVRLIPLTLVIALASCEPSYANDAQYRLNALVWKGTHNSYHLASLGAPPSLDYSHDPLDVQLDREGVRQLELDVYFDGDRFLVMHIPLFDQRSTCATLDDCLTVVGAWSSAHPAHAPIVILIELKDDTSRVPMAPFIALLDDTVRSRLSAGALITPALVRRDAASLPDALATFGWPTLAETRGKFLVVVLPDQSFIDAYTAAEHPLFLAAGPGQPYSAVASYDDPNDPGVSAALAANMIVRTRSDDPEIVEDYAARARAAFASGAQIISTDYPVTKKGYRLAWPAGAIVDCHQTLAPLGCDPHELEEL